MTVENPVPTPQQRVEAVLERIGYNLLDTHKKMIELWIDSVSADTVNKTVSLIEKDYPGGMVAGAAKRPLFNFLSEFAPDVITSWDFEVEFGINTLDSFLDNAAKAGSA